MSRGKGEVRLCPYYPVKPLYHPIMKFITYLANGGALWIGICVLLLILKKTRTTGIVCSCSLAVTFLINNIILKNIIATVITA